MDLSHVNYASCLESGELPHGSARCSGNRACEFLATIAICDKGLEVPPSKRIQLISRSSTDIHLCQFLNNSLDHIPLRLRSPWEPLIYKQPPAPLVESLDALVLQQQVLVQY